MRTKIRNISILMRLVVFGMIGMLVISSLYHYIVNDSINFGVDPNMINQLWHHPEASKTMLLGFILPGFVLVLVFGYWLQKLFLLFQQGVFFSQNNMRCFVWLVWLNFLSGIDDIFSPFLLGFYGQKFDSNIRPELAFEMIEFFTMMLLIIIVYLLKEAKQLDKENKEFV